MISLYIILLVIYQFVKLEEVKKQHYQLQSARDHFCHS